MRELKRLKELLDVSEGVVTDKLKKLVASAKVALIFYNELGSDVASVKLTKAAAVEWEVTVQFKDSVEKRTFDNRTPLVKKIEYETRLLSGPKDSPIDTVYLDSVKVDGIFAVLYFKKEAE